MPTRSPVANRSAPRRPDHLADHLVAGDERQLRLGELAVDDVEVGATDAAGEHLDLHLAARGLGLGRLERRERPALLLKHHRAHLRTG